MAQVYGITLPAPPPLSFSEPSSLPKLWKNWRRQWNHYSIATGLADKSEDVQVSTLLTCLGQDALNVLDGLLPSEEDQKCLDTVIEKFEEFCVGKTNETFERYKFNMRNQERGETIDMYVAELRKLAKTCNYQTLEESLIRDRVVLGIPEVAVRKRLLQESDLTLNKAISVVQAHEATLRQMDRLEPAGEGAELHVVHKQRPRGTTSGSDRVSEPTNQMRPMTCKFCGKKHAFRKGLCPAWGKSCTSCGGKNHFASRCHAPQVQMIDPDSETSEADMTDEHSKPSVYQLDGGAVSDRRSGKLFARLLLGKDYLQRFLMDTGASANIIPLHVYKKAYPQPSMRKLKPCDISLIMFNKSTTKVVGKAMMEVMNPKNCSSYNVEFLIVREDFAPLIGSKTLQEMDLIEVKTENIACLSSEDTNAESTKKRCLENGKTSADEEMLSEYDDVFSGVGKLPGILHVQTDEQATPVQMATRSVPEALREEVKTELDRLVEDGIVKTVSEPTEWISAMVAVRKPSSGIRICIDPTPLNRAIKRNHYPLPTIDDLTPALSEAKVFSVCDVKSGYWHVELDEESSFLTTFTTPWGRYRWCRMPFGLRCASEEFQRRLHMALEGLEGVRAIADDILVYGVGATQEEAMKDHDVKLRSLLERCREKKVRLNMSKMKLRQTQVKYMGHMFTAQGLKADPEKVQAVVNMPAPEDRKGVQRVLGLVNYLQPFAPKLAAISAPLRALLKKDTEFYYDENVHGKALTEIKRVITRDPVLRYYDVRDDVVVQVDASQHGLGACLLQRNQPVAYASRALNDTEQNYAQIEKEMLAILFGLSKFERFTLGKRVMVESDHKPLETIVRKPLTSAPKRLQRMMLYLQKYDYEVVYKRGQEMYVADALSRAHEGHSTRQLRPDEQVCWFEDISVAEKDLRNVNMLEEMPVADVTVEIIRKATLEDHKMADLKALIRDGWPSRKELVPHWLRQYYPYKEELSVKQGLIFKGGRILVPEAARAQMKQRSHASHIGLNGCLRRAREVIFWPGMSQEIENYISRCTICLEYGRKQQRETMKPHEVPTRPWQNIACDLMDLSGYAYLVTVDTYSDFIEVDRVSSKSASEIIRLLKSQMARHGIPEKLMTDNGPPFSSSEFARFSREFEFRHVTSSPRYPQSNGKAESAVKILKNLMMKAQADNRDIYLTLLDWRNTPTEGVGSSPAQRLFGRRTRTLLPSNGHLLKPKLASGVQSKLVRRQGKQVSLYNRGAKDLPPLETGDKVFMEPKPGRSSWNPAVVTESLGNRSYNVRTTTGAVYRRNRRHLRYCPGNETRSGSTQSQEGSDDEYMFIHVPSASSRQAAASASPRSARQGPVRSPYLLKTRASEVTVSPPQQGGNLSSENGGCDVA